MIPVQNTSTSAAFQFWLNRTNEMANYFSTCTVTTDANNDTIAASGNAAITGNFTANGLVLGTGSSNVIANSTSIKLSNSTVNTTITIPTSNQYTNNFVLAANGTWTFVPVSNGSLTLSGTNLKTIDYYAKSQYAGAEYLISVVDSGANNRYITKVLTTHDSNNALITEYASFTTNNSVGVFSTSSNDTHVILNYTPTISNYTVKFVRTVI